MKKREKNAELLLFNYESVSVATNNFSTVNKLGEGGFGPVNKVHYIFLLNVLWTLLRKPTLVVNLHKSLKSLIMVLLHRRIYSEGRKLQWRCYQKDLDRELRSSEMRQY
jgi:hypothetical protein